MSTAFVRGGRIRWVEGGLAGGLVLAIGVFALWVWASGSSLVATPWDAARNLRERMSEGSLWDPLLWTVQATLFGFGIGAGAGIATGVMLGLSARLRMAFVPAILSFASVPKIVFYPICLTLLKVGMSSEVAFVAIGSFTPVFVHCLEAIQGIPAVYRKLSRSYGLSPMLSAIKVYLPATAPSVVVGLRLSLSLALIHAVLAEMTVARGGLGVDLIRFYGRAEIDAVYGIIVVLMLGALVINVALGSLERVLRGPSASS
jgi:NitT/TauT family transport system permease protein